MVTKFKTITPKKLNTNAMLDVFRELVKEEIRAADKEFGKTYDTFEHEPEFEQEYTETNSTIEGATLTSGRGSRDNPYPFVTKGTRVRYATMTPDFQAKTKHRVIGSSRGRGGLLYVNKRKPRPGIKAREFEEEIAQREQPKFTRRGRRAMKIARKKSGHSI